MKYLIAALSALFLVPGALAQDECITPCTDHCDTLDSYECFSGFICACTCDAAIPIPEFPGDLCGQALELENLLICFSSETMADVEGKGSVSMSELRVGDRVLTADGKYETVYAIDHRHPTKLTHFLQIHHDSEAKPLELTKDHMLFLEGNSNPVPASSVKVGDQVQTMEGPSTVTKVENVVRAGLYSPLTTDGTIVASGIVASTYSAQFGNSEWIEVGGMKVMTHQSFFDKALKPYRYMCTGLSLELCKTDKERVAISEFASNLLNHVRSSPSTMYYNAWLCFALFLVVVVDFILSPQSLILAASLVAAYQMTKKANAKKL